MSFERTLLHATEKVHECLEHCAPGAPRGSRWIVTGLRHSCTTLGDLLIDPELLRFLRPRDNVVELEEGRRMLASYRENGEALNRFLAAERELFLRAGLPVSATEHLLDRIRDVITKPRAHQPDELVGNLVSLKNYVCNGIDHWESDRKRAILHGVRDVFGGLTVATLNGGLLAATVGITGAVSAVSVAAGGMIAADGYANVRKLF